MTFIKLFTPKNYVGTQNSVLICVENQPKISRNLVKIKPKIYRKYTEIKPKNRRNRT